MAPPTYKQIVLNERPVGPITPTTFRTEAVPLDHALAPRAVLVQVTWLSLDPAMRGWLKDRRSYVPPVQIGEVMRAMGLGVVIGAGSESTLKVGDVVVGRLGWREYAVLEDTAVQKIVLPEGAEYLDFLGVLGSVGLTAYFGLNDVGKLKPGETLVVTGAAGAVGAVACQLGKKAGAKVFAVAGSPEKCAWLESELGVDRAFNYKSATFREDFAEIGYLDVLFENVGGDILDLALTRLNKNARIVLCGAISSYNDEKPKGLQNYDQLIMQRARIEGFVVFDYAEHFPAAIRELARGLGDGSLKRKFHIVEGGVEQAPVALPLLFSGGNHGKLVVKVSQWPQ